ncbi:hypothetical protein A5780_19150 [Nocardia sp. 852002-20019_SCH5090214]|uniref:hypothetical protein n=1 Tax=Nocardia sp. 852002-20019_SCH5090214 TaxID=1834087 RepID=UPI0007FD0822|nr:hypothetical protein [Nocardia sp. 852002-20019_SCH5090214]OBA62178.1 hypothetical protein A5780_19150 [Nocardia sp. 852002-20019_SCH5090214]
MTPELIQAIGVAIVGIIGAFTAWQAKKVSELQSRVAELETQMAAERGKFRAAARVIRALQRYIDQLTDLLTRAGQNPPPNPVVMPPELEEDL